MNRSMSANDLLANQVRFSSYQHWELFSALLKIFGYTFVFQIVRSVYSLIYHQSVAVTHFNPHHSLFSTALW